MKKTLMSIALGLVLAGVPVAIFACADLITSGTTVCTLSGSANGGTICFYNCTTIKPDNPGPETPGQN
jgi:hypothetical protein